MNILAFYLPQYHAIPENDEWWGKDYTEWDSLRRGEMLIEGQYQPRIPLEQNYYNLLDVDVMKWQAQLAKRAGIYGFCVYHYWFNGKLLLEKPMENLLAHKEIDFPFCFCWANEDWSNIWEGNLDTIKILISNRYDDKSDWIKHFDYFLPFFKDDRYIKVDNKPVLAIFNPLLIPRMKEIIDCWNQMAIEAGFSGIIFMYQNCQTLLSDDKRKYLFDYGMEYYPGLAAFAKKEKNDLKRDRVIHNIGTYIRQNTGLQLNRKIKENASGNRKIKQIESYDEVWDFILSRDIKEENTIPGAFVDWDNTPRRKYAGKVILGATPEKFKEYLRRQIVRAKEVYHKNLMVIFAWNEWSEGGYLEPDEKYGYAYLDAIHNTLQSLNELPTGEFSIESNRRN